MANVRSSEAQVRGWHMDCCGWPGIRHQRAPDTALRLEHCSHLNTPVHLGLWWHGLQPGIPWAAQVHSRSASLGWPAYACAGPSVCPWGRHLIDSLSGGLLHGVLFSACICATLEVHHWPAKHAYFLLFVSTGGLGACGLAALVGLHVVWRLYGPGGRSCLMCRLAV